LRVKCIWLFAACLQVVGMTSAFANVRTHHGLGRGAHRGRHYAAVYHRRHWSRTATVAAGQSYATAYERSGAFAGRDRGGVVTVNTAAGIPITVASSAASKFEGFISDLVASGYKPRQIHCLAHGGHVRDSNHYWGGACDIDQSARGRTAGRMYHVVELANKWGLRDGCSFGDCGHVDVPLNGGVRIANRTRRRG
jgi:hypothetical protein